MFFKRSLLIVLIIITPLHIVFADYIFSALPFEIKQKHIEEVDTQIQQRWAKLKANKASFARYQKKSDGIIREEFRKLHLMRQNLWYRNPEGSPHISQLDYMLDQRLLEKGLYRTVNNMAFSYNCVDSTYNASTILVNGFHFIALMEPLESTLLSFFKLLINHGASILVRLKPEEEFANAGTINYWKDNLIENQGIDLLNLDVSIPNWPAKPVQIPYFYTNAWKDDKGMNVQDLYQLVQQVRLAYLKSETKGPIAVHCASGVGRTGTFIAAFILADLLDRLKANEVSIEEVALRLSIQRPNMVGTEDQYILLYRFIDYYLEQKSKSTS
ncbi:MAG: tyrosine-protein phosphatase [Alphaproteobacteria bacterium]|nr:tyrosine-protein phosphatase [Alphaproteobacteria bacterium]